ncbi:ArsR/SmtB family transcription factor [Salinactinospora qingdaonensis]|uniref:HTH arsR-type domain-containing protein n=1 Tax=Salinactinospora qingdaonensis TaxID=702744 RepID=A0ABP7F4G7_9ACTN
MLRIHFSDRDWQRLRIASRPEPMWEMVLSLYMLGEASEGLVFGQWRQRVLHRLLHHGRRLLELVPPEGYSPDFLSLDLRYGQGNSPTWTNALMRKDTAAMRWLGQALNSYFDVALRPYRSYIYGVVERSARLAREGTPETSPDRSPCTAGTDRNETAQHRRDQLRRTAGPAPERTRPAAGTSVLLREKPGHLPRQFATARADVPLEHPPVSFLAKAAAGTGPTTEVLGRLLGQTRAAVLRSLCTEQTRGELAREVGISPSSASEHATLLREAGLVASERHGNTVRQSLTTLGLELLYPSR